MKVIKNAKAYDGTDAIITGLGQILEDVVAVSYSTTRDHQMNYSIGSRRGTSWSMGKDANAGSITILMAGVVPLQKAARDQGGSILDIKPFNLNVTFVDDYNELVNDTIVCKFASTGRDVSTEMGLQKEYELFVLEVQEANV